MAKKPKAICVVSGCKNYRKCRGLCSGCYQNARKAVAAGDTTWENLERLGLAAPVNGDKRGRPMSKFRTALIDKTGEDYESVKHDAAAKQDDSEKPQEYSFCTVPPNKKPYLIRKLDNGHLAIVRPEDAPTEYRALNLQMPPDPPELSEKAMPDTPHDAEQLPPEARSEIDEIKDQPAALMTAEQWAAQQQVSPTEMTRAHALSRAVEMPPSHIDTTPMTPKDIITMPSPLRQQVQEPAPCDPRTPEMRAEDDVVAQNIDVGRHLPGEALTAISSLPTIQPEGHAATYSPPPPPPAQTIQTPAQRIAACQECVNGCVACMSPLDVASAPPVTEPLFPPEAVQEASSPPELPDPAGLDVSHVVTKPEPLMENFTYHKPPWEN